MYAGRAGPGTPPPLKHESSRIDDGGDKDAKLRTQKSARKKSNRDDQGDVDNRMPSRSPASASSDDATSSDERPPSSGGGSTPSSLSTLVAAAGLSGFPGGALGGLGLGMPPSSEPPPKPTPALKFSVSAILGSSDHHHHHHAPRPSPSPGENGDATALMIHKKIYLYRTDFCIFIPLEAKSTLLVVSYMTISEKFRSPSCNNHFGVLISGEKRLETTNLAGTKQIVLLSTDSVFSSPPFFGFGYSVGGAGQPQQQGAGIAKPIPRPAAVFNPHLHPLLRNPYLTGEYSKRTTRFTCASYTSSQNFNINRGGDVPTIFKLNEALLTKRSVSKNSSRPSKKIPSYCECLFADAPAGFLLAVSPGAGQAGGQGLAQGAVFPLPGSFPWAHSSRGKPRRGMMRRAVFSDLQRKGLEKRFQLQKYISKPDRKRLADKLGLKDSQNEEDTAQKGCSFRNNLGRVDWNLHPFGRRNRVAYALLLATNTGYPPQ
ncbi:hypothetical protein FOCC_FOCC011513 [Frankliniella occidentalis]|nr:hypothetical protein FOCC_FOCC011513 [Frankliniella occidentalis]